MTTDSEPTPLSEALPLAIPQPVEPIDLEGRAEAYLADAVLRTRQEYFKANCPVAFQDFDPDRLELQTNRAQIDRVLSWQNGPRGIVASGETAKGKTRSMFTLCRRLLCDEGRDVGIWHAKDFFAELEQNVRYGRDEASYFVKRQASRSILFIDDYGQEALAANKQDWATGWFFRMLDLRIGHRLPLLLTTNLTSRQLAENSREVTGDPLVRRLLELCEPIKFL